MADHVLGLNVCPCWSSCGPGAPLLYQKGFSGENPIFAFPTTFCEAFFGEVVKLTILNVDDDENREDHDLGEI